MKTIRTTHILETKLNTIRLQNKTIGLVPTMGALHAGHLSLIKKAKENTRVVVVTIFVNPTQFNDKTDLKNYPRDLTHDLSLLDPILTNKDIVFSPAQKEMYPVPDTRKFDFGNMERVMEGAFRPGHFNGVAQIVSKFFMLIYPEMAFFGEKDFQQLAIIRKLTILLDLPVKIIGCPIIRESDGLAMSSRNQLLGKRERAAAPQIYKSLCHAVNLADKFTPGEVKKQITKEVDQVPELSVEYFEIVNGNNLQPVNQWVPDIPIQGCIAVKAGKVRLIDNIKFQ